MVFKWWYDTIWFCNYHLFVNEFIKVISIFVLFYCCSLVFFLRVLICYGIIKIFWKHLSSPLFDCHVNCDEQGNVIIGLKGAGKENSSCSLFPSSLGVCFHLRNTQQQQPKEKDTAMFKEWNPLSTSSAAKRMSMKIIEYEESSSDIEDPFTSSKLQFDKTNQQILQTAIYQKVIWFVRFGYALLIIGILINVVWIYLLFQISNDIEYKPLAGL
jgi:hypothetical protein